MSNLKTPDITPAQVGAAVGAVAAFAAAAGIPMSKDLQDHLIVLATVLAPAIVAADAHIRNGRSRPRPAEPSVVGASDEVAAPAQQALGEAAPQPSLGAVASAASPIEPPQGAEPASRALEALKSAESVALTVGPQEELFVVRWVKPPDVDGRPSVPV
jgi:hypothetical protein